VRRGSGYHQSHDVSLARDRTGRYDLPTRRQYVFGEPTGTAYVTRMEYVLALYTDGESDPWGWLGLAGAGLTVRRNDPT
jgi:hypothetical protein